MSQSAQARALAQSREGESPGEPACDAAQSRKGEPPCEPHCDAACPASTEESGPEPRSRKVTRSHVRHSDKKPTQATPRRAPKEPRAIDGLLQIAANARVFRVPDGRSFAQVTAEDRQELYSLGSAEFRNWLVGCYLASSSGKPPSRWSLRGVIETLEAKARIDTGARSVSIRVARAVSDQGSTIYIDLGDGTGRAVAINASGWSIVERPSAAFQRTDGMLPMPEPGRDGSVQLLRPYVNLSDRDFRLLIAWLAAALRPVGPYPILALYGEQGSAKSTLAKIVRLFVDPHAVPLLVEPKSRRDLMITALNGWLLAYDNISAIRPWLSDGLCLVATGGGYAGRTEYTGLERTIFQVQRPTVLTGIDEFIRRGDLSDRSLILHLPPIPESARRREDEMWAALERDRARIFGGLLDAIVGGLRELPNVRLAKLPRMADFAAASEAIGRALGWPEGTFLADYEANRREASITQIEDSLVATVLLQNAARLGAWMGKPTELLADLCAAIGPKEAASARWPKTPERFTNELRRIAPQLRLHGLRLTFGRTRSARFIALEPSKAG
jgi:hypothetical protein